MISSARVRMATALLALAVLGVTAALVVSPSRAATPAARLLVPAYFDPPSRTWTAALSAPSSAILIANPDNGPGTSVLPAYVRLTAQAARAGHDLIGYVHTSNGTRPIAAVERDISRWAGFYGVHDIFFDEVSESAAQLPYYRAVVGYAHAHGARLTVLNPGVVPARGYFGLGSVVVTFEDTYAHFRHARFPAWLRTEPASQQANIVYGVPNAAAAQATLARIHSDGAGVAYVTNESGDDPYAGLPPYLGRETGWLNG